MSSQRSSEDGSTWLGCLTPPGAGAIATLAIVGPKGWQAVRSIFHGRNPLPPKPIAGRTWHGWLGEEVRDDVVISADPTRAPGWVEIHCHGGAEVIKLLCETLEAQGIFPVHWQRLIQMSESSPLRADALIALARAQTLQTADILLWQSQGAFEAAVTEIENSFAKGDAQAVIGALQALARRTPLGRHLTQPWRIAIAGAPNVGKSSLMNALAGYQRSIVAPTAGTTRDVVSTMLAFEGWPVAAADTAGIRAVEDALETAGIERAQRELETADFCLWILDGATDPVWPAVAASKMILVINKADLPASWDFRRAAGAYAVSALTGQGIAGLSVAIARTLVPDPPKPGEGVPFSAALCDAIDQAWWRLQAGKFEEARQLVHKLLAGDYERETLQGT